MKTWLILIFALFTLAAVAAGAWWVYTQLQPASSKASGRYVMIEEGATAGEVAGMLAEKEIVRDATVFYLYARFQDRASGIRSGFYRFSPDQTPDEILEMLNEGDVENIAIRIPSGADLKKIVSILRGRGFGQNDIETAFTREYDASILAYKPDHADLEGYLYPDTYHLAANARAGGLVKMALENTQQHLNPALRDQWRNQGLSVHEGLTLASIVQKEVSESRQRAKVAQVFLSRLDEGQPLEADPTFQYAARQKGIEATSEIDSPYNTYRHSGLPPGPIANVTIGAMEAVANPADTDYRYFVTGKDGVTRFSKTRRQHEAYIETHGVSGS